MGLPSDSCRWSQTPWQAAAGLLSALWQPLSHRSLPLSPSLLCGLPPHPNPPSASEGKSCQTQRKAARFLSSLGLNKGKQITKMEIFKLAFRGIQIGVWVARRHRPHSCYFVIKMIPKIPPRCGFHLLARLVSFPLRRSPVLWGAATPGHPGRAWICVDGDLASAGVSKNLNFTNARAVQPRAKPITKFRGVLPGSAAFCARDCSPGESRDLCAFHPRQENPPCACGVRGPRFPRSSACVLSPPSEKNISKVALELGLEIFYLTCS